MSKRIRSRWLLAASLCIVPRKTHSAGATIKVGVDKRATFPGELIDIPQVPVTARYLTMNYSDQPAKFLPEVTEALSAFEDQGITQSARAEATAKKLFNANEPELARGTLTDFSSRRALDALDLGDSLLGSIEARHRLLFGYRAALGSVMSANDGASFVTCAPPLR